MNKTTKGRIKKEAKDALKDRENMQKIQIRILTLVIMFSLLYVMRYVTLNMTIDGWTSIDAKVYDFIKLYINDVNTAIFSIITLLGKELIIVSIVITLFVYFYSKVILKFFKKVDNNERKTEIKSRILNLAMYLSISTSIVYLINKVLKNVFKRSRPNVLRLTVEDGFSFPSGHTISSTFFYFLLGNIIIFEIDNYIKLILKNADIKNINKIKTLSVIKTFVKVITTLIPILVGISRIYLGVHYFTDVAGAFMLGGLMYVLFSKMMYIKIKK